MKICATCGEVYLDPIDFCFEDGEVLGAASVVNDPVRMPPTRDLSDPTFLLIQQVAAAVLASVAAANPDLAAEYAALTPPPAPELVVAGPTTRTPAAAKARARQPRKWWQ